MPILTTDFGGTDSGNSLTRLSDGKLLFAGNSLLSGGNYVFALARYNADGTLDTTFDGDGKVTTDFTDNINGIENGKCVTVQADGKILVAGECEGDFAIVRYNTDGSLDTTFSNDGKVITTFGSSEFINSVIVQPDGKILAVGSTIGGYPTANLALARYNADGSLDTSFDLDGKLTLDIGIWDEPKSVKILSSGKIIVVGNAGYAGDLGDIELVRLNADGSFDSSFNGNGKVITDFGGGNTGLNVTELPNGKLLVTGFAQPLETHISISKYFTISLYNTDGTLDTSFSGDGKLTTDVGAMDVVSNVIVQDDGKILVSGVVYSNYAGNFALNRYYADGTLDSSFSVDGKLTTDLGGDDQCTSMIVQPDGKILLAGTSNGNFVTVRYNTDGSLDTTFSDPNTGTDGNDTLIAVGNNTLTGGAGDDTFSIVSGINTVTDLGNGADILTVFPGARVWVTAYGTYTATSSTSNNGRPLLNANGYNVSFASAGGSNGWTLYNTIPKGVTLVGSAHNDTIYGGWGAGTGNDTLTGGAGADTFCMLSGTNTITDFVHGTDILQFSHAKYSAITTWGSNEFYAAPGAIAGHISTDRIVYNTTTGNLYYDADGSGPGAAVLVALIGTTTHPALDWQDIQLVA